MSWDSLSEYLHPKVLSVAKKTWAKPTQIQLLAIPHVYGGENLVISAPTGMGKTEAVMLPIISRVLESKKESVQAIYIAPLRALVNNIYERLSAIGEKVGVRVGIRTGEKKKLAGQIIVTTPESFAWMVFSKGKDMLLGVRHIIIDEVHNAIYSDRGIYLSIVLEFLLELLQRKPQLVGLSATIPKQDEDLVKSFVKAEKIITIRTNDRKPSFLLSEAIQFQSNEASLCESILELFSLDLSQVGLYGKLFPSIIFGNSRRFTEYLATLLSNCIRGSFGVIHSDVKKRFREEYIRKFEDGELTGIVATSALGEGVDFVRARGVIQIASPGHPIFLKQRIGRARHSPEESPVAGIVSLSSVDILENIAIAGIVLEDIELNFIPAINSISAIAKAIANALSSNLTFSKNKEKILSIINRSSLIPDKELPEKVFNALVKDGIIKKKDDLYQLDRNKWNKLYRRSKEDKLGDIIARAMRHFYTVIPYQSKYDVVIINKRIKIGSLDPEFVSTRIRPLVTFQLAGRNLRVLKIDHFNMKIFVEEIDKAEKTIPFWLSPPIVRVKGIGEKMLDPEFLSKILKRKEIAYIRDSLKTLIRDLLREVSVIREALNGGIPAVALDTDEYFSITIFYPGGDGGNRYVAYALSKYFQDEFGPWSQPELKISPISLTLLWRMNRPTAEDFIKVLQHIDSDNEDAVLSVIGDYGRVEATLNLILDGIAMGAYRLDNLDNLAWEWIRSVQYRGLIDKEVGEQILSLLKQKQVVWIDDSKVSFLLNGILQLPEEKMGYKAYREALKRKIIETLKNIDHPISLEELASATGYRRSKAVLYEMVYGLIEEGKIRVSYSEKGSELPAKVQVLIKKYGKTKQYYVYLPGKILFELGQNPAKLENTIPIEPDLIELVIKADLQNANTILNNLRNYIREKMGQILTELLQKTRDMGDIDLFENIPKIKIIIEVPPPKTHLRQKFISLDELKKALTKVRKYSK